MFRNCIKNLIGTVMAAMLVMTPCVGVADTSDYIWNQQFTKKMALAEKGDQTAQYEVGNMLQKGQGTPVDLAKAFKWFNKAADQGNIRAGYKLGYMYHRGDGVTKNNDKAFQWIKKAANEDYAPAMFYLGQLYASGAGTNKDLRQALSWYQKASAKGYYPAKAAVKATKQHIAESAPPPPVAAPAPVQQASAVRPVAVAKPSSPPKKAASDADPLSFLLGSTWKRDGKPAAEFPSQATACSEKRKRIICNSKEIEAKESYGTVTYKIEAMIGNFKGNEFSNQYRKNVTLIFPKDPDNAKAKIPIEYGPQQPKLMRCKFDGKDSISCTTPDKKVLSFKKS
jgi:hypothetical protein